MTVRSGPVAVNDLAGASPMLLLVGAADRAELW
jgi:hypothetical protein